MFDDHTKLISAMRSPLQIEAMALDEIQQRIGGDKIIADNNSPFCHLLEFGSSIAAACINNIDDKLPSIYPQRALTMRDLYQHMSDYDYLRMYASPAQTTFTIILNKAYLLNNTLQYNERYRKMTIPRDSVFAIGKYIFGIHYPIDILINTSTKSIMVNYDTSEDNPLHVLTKNVVDTYSTKYMSQEYLVLQFPIYQFTRSIVQETLTAEIGYFKKITYNYNFYAIRIHHYKGGAWHELGLTQSENVYDITRPTALIRVYPDEHQLTISLPQIYFDSDALGSKIYIEVYTTLGAMDVDTTNLDLSSIRANFSKQGSRFDTKYASALRSYPYDNLFMINSNITGGSNPVDVRTLRDRVVNNTLYESVPISEQQLSVYLNEHNFYMKKYKDNITDRIYYAYRTLTDGAGSLLPSLNGEIKLDTESIKDCSTIISQGDGSSTILPSTIYSYDQSTGSATPLTTEELGEIAAFDKSELVEFLNNGDYFKSPFHIRVDLSSSQPTAVSYNLLSPSVNKVIFVEANYNAGVQFTSFTATVEHDTERGSYYLAIPVLMSEVLMENIGSTLIYALIKTTDGYWTGAECELDHIDSTTTAVFKLKITTNYHITETGGLGVTNFTSSSSTGSSSSESIIGLDSDVYLVFLARRDVIPDAGDATQAVTEGLPDRYSLDYVAISRQYVSVHFGHKLDDVIDNNITTSATPIRYRTWEHDVPATYEEDIYEHDVSGMLVYKIEDDQVILNKLHSLGEAVLDGQGNPVYAHRAGDLQLDDHGDPVPIVERINTYYIDAILISAKVFASERSAELNFVNSLYSSLESYFETVRSLQDQLLERTYVYFKCIRSTGTANFNYGDGVTGVSNIEMSFHIACYVPSHIRKDTAIQKTIKDQICTSIEAAMNSRTISMLDIFEQVKDKMSDYVDHFTLLGVNGDVTHQTFAVDSDDAKPSIARVLTLTEDNVLSLNKDIKIDFIALEDNTAQQSSYQG